MTADVEMLPLLEATMKSYQTDSTMRTMTLYSYSASDMRDYARANVARAIAAKDAEIEALRAEVDEWKDAARCASEQQDSLFREARALNERADNLRAEVERANSWNERVSVCRDHVADIVDGPCVICALDAAKARADKLAEALRHSRWCLTCAEDGWDSCDDGRKNDALLRDQEEGK